MKPEDFKWEWCFHCDCSFSRCPFCNTNSCSCGCSHPEPKPCGQWWKDLIEAEKTEFRPDIPSKEEAEERIAYWQGRIADPKSYESGPESVLHNMHIPRHELERLAVYAAHHGLECPTFRQFQKAMHDSLTPQQMAREIRRLNELRKWVRENKNKKRPSGD